MYVNLRERLWVLAFAGVCLALGLYLLHATGTP